MTRPALAILCVLLGVQCSSSKPSLSRAFLEARAAEVANKKSSGAQGVTPPASAPLLVATASSIPASPQSPARVGEGAPKGAPEQSHRHSVVRGPSGGTPATIRLRLTHAERIAAARWLIHENGRPLRPRKDGGTAGELTVDSFALLQTVRGFADWHRRRDLKTDGDALRALGPHTAGNKPTLRHRRLVSRGLPGDSLLRPSHWDDCDGDWESYAGNWAAFRKAVAIAVDGFAPPCPRNPVAEGWPEDDHIAIGRGLVRLPCGERLHFWAPPEDDATALASARGERR